jgi:hypothetical protein
MTRTRAKTRRTVHFDTCPQLRSRLPAGTPHGPHGRPFSCPQLCEGMSPELANNFPSDTKSSAFPFSDCPCIAEKVRGVHKKRSRRCLRKRNVWIARSSGRGGVQDRLAYAYVVQPRSQERQVCRIHTPRSMNTMGGAYNDFDALTRGDAFAQYHLIFTYQLALVSQQSAMF